MTSATHGTTTDADAGAAGRAIRVYEPALCCNTGVCGPDVDDALVRFTADLGYLRDAGVDITRHNLANDPGAFAEDPTVAGFLRTVGSAGLPLVLADGVTVAVGRYPDREELLRLAGRAAQPDPGPAAAADAGGCCGGGAPSGCC